MIFFKLKGIEHIEELTNLSINNVKKWNPEMLNSGNLKLVGKWFMIQIIKKHTISQNKYLFNLKTS